MNPIYCLKEKASEVYHGLSAHRTIRRVAFIGVGLLISLLLVSGSGFAAERGNKHESKLKALKEAIEGGRARNVILMIGDGMDDSIITAARNYLVGAAGKLALDELPLTGQMTTYSVREDDPSKPDYDPESASTSTAWSTGFKTSDGRISTAPGTGQILTTILELAQRAGLRVGNVTTAELTDATPAAPMAHVRLRACQGPLDMATCPQDLKTVGGLGSIAEQGVDKKIDVLLGGGKQRFDQVIPAGQGPFAGKTVLQSAIDQGYQVVTDRSGLLAAPAGTKLLGLFTPGNMSVEFGGAAASNPPSGPQRCLEGQRPANEPSLDEMTAKAIALLDQTQAQGKGKDRGFFLQIESAHIDKREHASQPCQAIGEVLNFDRALQVALAYAGDHKDTLIIVTGDHAHSTQIVEVDANPAGFSSILITDEGEAMRLAYGTAAGANAGAVSQEHTGAQVRVAAQGPHAYKVIGLIDQTDLFHIMSQALGLPNSSGALVSAK